MIGAHALMLTAARNPVVVQPSHKAHGLIYDLFGWLIVGVVIFVAVKFVRGRKNAAKATAEALAAAMAQLVAEVHTAASAHAGADARNAMAVHIGGDGRHDDDIDQLAARVAALLRADLSEHDGNDARPDINDQLYRAAADMLAGVGPRHGLDAGRAAGRPVPARAVERGAPHRDDSPVTA